ncbi:saccharopine dehydrogenase family protein [Parachitinimonas caeni]|uniref:Saccharopine dehydrogenase NADP-binding domain-containing protein n=1 Tax=Parachitinimonas caeni TaxID=3031301 RepID=A0ABT7E2P7_9NEIS|nr:saccharopine dehydrogenase NADP-binding domain-containing protein [Parachitinimonas caeni]MDK2126587.1 saccharopine dehydrogenase NADP-binding domain-containing protein [Parachitinimonas caeni]
MKNWMIYGVTGYTGRLIAEAASQQGLQPLLAGRDAGRVAAIASSLGCPGLAVSLEDGAALDRALQGLSLVLNCAGPFSRTAQPLVEACLRQGVHYLDITGEIAVFEALHPCDAQARSRGVVLCPGVGFDVIPTDCVAAALKQALPDATELALGFDSRSGASPGTARTSVEGIGSGGRVRRNGRLEPAPLGFKTRQIDFGEGERTAVTIPWGDLATAWISTGIGNIETYLSMPPKRITQMRWLERLRPLLARGPAQWLLKALAGKVSGPSAEQRANMGTLVWGEVRNAAGVSKTARLRCANGYQLTVDGSLAAVREVLQREGPGGYFTPSQLFGWQWVEGLPGSGRIVIGEAG